MFWLGSVYGSFFVAVMFLLCSVGYIPAMICAWFRLIFWLCIGSVGNVLTTYVPSMLRLWFRLPSGYVQLADFQLIFHRMATEAS